MRTVLVAGLLLSAAACRSSSPPHPIVGQETDPDAGSAGLVDAGSAGETSDAGPVRTQDAGDASSCAPAVPAAVLSSSPTLLLRDERSNEDWVYEHPILQGHLLYQSWGAAPDDVWALASEHSIAHWDGRGWTIGAPVNTNYSLRDLWGSGRDDVWALDGFGGTLVHFDGSAWSAVPIGGAPWGMVGLGRSEFFLNMGPGGGVRYFDGTSWTDLPPAGRPIRDPDSRPAA